MNRCRQYDHKHQRHYYPNYWNLFTVQHHDSKQGEKKGKSTLMMMITKTTTKNDEKKTDIIRLLYILYNAVVYIVIKNRM